MKVLVLGGTKFVGRAIAEEALAKGHDVTLFNRGNRTSVAGCTTLVGDRRAADGYQALEGLSFDIVFDTWGKEANAVKSAVDALRGRIKQYVFISTVSVYDVSSQPSLYDENQTLYDPEKAPIAYCKDKVESENATESSGVPALILRPGLIIGPYEETNGRLTWWLERLDRGGSTLVPGPQDSKLQFIDVRDLAAFALHGAENGLSGLYNVVAPKGTVTLGEVLLQAQSATDNKAKLCWMTPEQIKEAELKAFIEFPMWLTTPSNVIFNADSSKAVAAGLTFRPLSLTVNDTWEYMKGLGDKGAPNDSGMALGIEKEKELKILKQYFPEETD